MEKQKGRSWEAKWLAQDHTASLGPWEESSPEGSCLPASDSSLYPVETKGPLSSAPEVGGECVGTGIPSAGSDWHEGKEEGNQHLLSIH